MIDSGALLLAFGFSSPALLGGLVLAAIPLIVHLLHRRRYVEHDWAAMRFLAAAIRKESRRVRLQNLILLLLRTLLIAGLVLALARPFLDQRDGLLNTQQPVHRILVIDTSFSMQAERQGAAASFAVDEERSTDTRFAQAQEILRKVIDSGRRGDAWNLVRTGGPEPLAVVARPSFRRDSVRDEIDRLRPSDTAGNLLRTLVSVREMIDRVPELTHKEVVFVSDLQAAFWAPPADDARTKIAELIRQIASQARITVISCGSGNASNSAVVSARVGEFPVISGRPVELACVVRNLGSSLLREQVVELLIDGRIVDTRRVDLSPGIDVPVEFQSTFADAGQHVVEFRIEADSLPVDNRRWKIVDVREGLRVLLVDGRPAGRRRDRASYYLERALAPYSSSTSVAGDDFLSLIRPHVVTEGELPSVPLADYDAVVLCDVGLLTEREAVLLEGYVRSGGGLVIFPGDRTQADSFNTRLFQDGRGILPARIGERVTTSSDANVLTFDARNFGHPLVSAFRGNPDAGLESTITVSYLTLEPAESAATALWFSDGAPALVERQAGQGHVVLAATGADDRWGTWAIWAPSFVPMMHETVRFAASGRWKQRDWLVGEDVTLVMDARAGADSASVCRPDGIEADLRLSLDPESDLSTRSGVLEAPARAGVYEVRTDASTVGGSQPQFFAVNIDAAESDLTPVDQHRLQSELYREISVQSDSVIEQRGSAVGSENSAVAAMSRTLAWLVLLGLLTEPVLAWRFSIGLLAGAVLLVSAAGVRFGPVHALEIAAVCAGVWWLKRRYSVHESKDAIPTRP